VPPLRAGRRWKRSCGERTGCCWRRPGP
jgi:hypothetical protein